MTRETISKDKERQLIINLITSTKFCSQILPLMKSEYLDIPYSKVVFNWCKEYWEEFHEAPQGHIKDIWESNKLSIESDDENIEDSISIFLGSISEEYENTESKNIDYLIKDFNAYLKLKAKENNIDKFQEAMDKDDLEEALRLSGKILKEDDETGIEPKELFSRIGDIEIKPMQWVIRGLFQIDSSTVFFGDPGAGKSFLGLDIAASIACGINFHSMTTKISGPTLYVAGEGRYTISRRMAAWSKHHEIDLKEYPFYILNSEIELVDEKKLLPLKQALEEINKKDGRPCAVIIDTWSTCRGGNNENDNSETAKALNNLRVVCKPYECSRFIIHHSGVADKTRSRGASSFKGNIDNEYRVEKSPLGKISLINTKTKDGPEPDKMFFDLINVNLGLKDEFGYEESSAVLVQDGDYIPTKKSRLGKNEKLAMELLGEHKANIRLWRESILAKGVSKSIYSQVKAQLIEKGLINEDNGYIFKI